MYDELETQVISLKNLRLAQESYGCLAVPVLITERLELPGD